jgi:hypothetical protein
VQDQRHGYGRSDRGDQVQVKHGVAGQHGVRAADRHGQRVDAGAGSVHAVLATDLAELGLDPHPAGMTPAGHLGGGRDVGGVVQSRGVVHDRAQAEPGRLADQVGAGGVVQVNGRRDVGIAGHGQAGAGDRAQRTVIGDAVLADLQDHRGGSGFGPGHDGLGVLDADHVERADAPARGPGPADDLAHGGKRHQEARLSADAAASSVAAGPAVAAGLAVMAGSAITAVAASRGGGTCSTVAEVKAAR